ncbi:hypothetical protein M431DRAFT_417446 [Trichoderma harzianum CBS 226.95]|uniref:Uncharacterized protein n=1 Tax=Trichoderma harzianum CBS 226.95 TaxID=983964 RepID=A0A2T4AGB2_TRIHA|nr:hypothetical protein M431DRAFT_417446 [Trichoderma harzianum CBS 226.95]PTB56107.1 hypothetical protein M431DRAFT_417446 [Trichoderma harzianum CBS 226.95]
MFQYYSSTPAATPPTSISISFDASPRLGLPTCILADGDITDHQRTGDGLGSGDVSLTRTCSSYQQHHRPSSVCNYRYLRSVVCVVLHRCDSSNNSTRSACPFWVCSKCMRLASRDSMPPRDPVYSMIDSGHSIAKFTVFFAPRRGLRLVWWRRTTARTTLSKLAMERPGLSGMAFGS